MEKKEVRKALIIVSNDVAIVKLPVGGYTDPFQNWKDRWTEPRGRELLIALALSEDGYFKADLKRTRLISTGFCEFYESDEN